MIKRGWGRRAAGWVFAASAAAVAVCGLVVSCGPRPRPVETPYQSVTLANGQTFFGKLEGFGTDHPVLTEVYFVQQQADAQKKEIRNVLVWRGGAWHAPDRMFLNPAQILFVEPVAPTSTVAQLIAVEQQKRAGAARGKPGGTKGN
jgi:hypothetical protein